MSRTVLRRLRALADPSKAAFFPRFFKAGKGEYAEGDRFLGVSVPQMRGVANEYAALPLADLERLLRSPWHEVRLTALLILVRQYERGDAQAKARAVRFYLTHLAGVNNWDLVDATAYKILGDWLRTRDRRPIHRLAKSRSMWEQRVAVVATYAFIREGDLGDTFAVADLLLCHPHDLLHKAVGWMLREAGKKNPDALRAFLRRRSSRMPRTMLRYAIERFPRAERSRWLGR